MRHFIKTINTTLTRSKTHSSMLSRYSSECLAPEHDTIMNPKSSRIRRPIDLPAHVSKNTPVSVLPRDDRPYLTAGGNHSSPVITTDTPQLSNENIETKIAYMRYYLETHYLKWKRDNKS